jgi:hypothetical protein
LEPDGQVLETFPAAPICHGSEEITCSHQKLRKLDLEGMQNFFFRKNGFLLRNMNCIARNYQQTPEIRAKLVFSDMFGHNDFDSNSST